MRLIEKFGRIPDLLFDRAAIRKRDAASGSYPVRGSVRGLSKRAVVIMQSVALAVGMSAAPAIFAAPVPVQVFQTSAGPVNITPIYHASAMIQAGGDTIYIDPASPANITGLRPGDLILITHTHPDHFDPAYIAKLSDSHTEIIGPAAVHKVLAKAKVMSNGQSLQWHNWKITAVAMYNIHHVMPNGKPYHPKGWGNGYVLTYGGKKFYFAGDTEKTPEMCALRNIDVAFLPMNLPYTMTPEEAAVAAKCFKPKIAIPYHYRGQDIQKFADALRGSGIEVRLLNWYSNIAPGAHPRQPPRRKTR
jgi:L-ascorbate metabolism protein UlaG (beta-lactamase superfamily)